MDKFQNLFPQSWGKDRFCALGFLKAAFNKTCCCQWAQHLALYQKT